MITSTISSFMNAPSIPTANISASKIDDRTFIIHDEGFFGDSCIIYFGDGDSLVGCNLTNIMHAYKTDGEYIITQIVSNSNGCANTITIKITTETEGTIFYPNSFSPDADGLNDVLYIYGGVFEEFKLRIYNRWGELIFQSNNNHIGWNGTYKGQPVEQGVYVWKVDYKFKQSIPKQLIGHVTVVR